MKQSKISHFIIIFVGLLGCSPTVKLEPSDKPIVVNLNVKIDHEVRVKVDKDLDKVISEDSELF